MKELTVENLSKTYGIKTLLDQVNFSIRTGDRVGVIGPNGTGKSSFLKVLVGIETYDQGTISMPNQYRIAYLDQNPQLDLNQTILETIYQGDSPLIKLVLTYSQVLENLNKNPMNEALQASYTDLSDKMTAHEGWDLEVKAKTILSQLGLDDLNKPLSSCSGGELKRVGLAQVLVAEPDLLILDEPTNHLDIKSIQWLEKYLANYKGALLLVTHDRYFLERSVNKIIELKHGKLTEYSGNYQDYLVKRAELADIQAKMQDKQDKLYQEELAWMRTGARARTTKQQARIDRFNDLSQEIKDRQQADQELDFDFDQQRIGKRILDIEDLSLKIGGKTVIDGFTKTFIKGETLGIVGPNGVGKSTFLNAIAGLQSLDQGKIELGQTVKLAYYRQMDQDLPADMRILDYLTEIADNFKRPDGTTLSASSLLERFNFPRASHGSLIGQLSGGEKRRLYLLSLLVQEPNVLILDEPTNDLDIDTLTILEDYLQAFEGIVLIVSHDRYFLDKLVDQLLVLKGGGDFDLYYGNYTSYLEKVQEDQKEEEKSKKEVKQVPVPSNKGKSNRMSYSEKQEWAGLEEKILLLEEEIGQLEADMNKYGSDLGKLMDLQKEIDSKNQKLLHLYERYDYLSEKEV